MCLYLIELVAHACITIRHSANDWVILNKVVLHIVSETVKDVCTKFVFYFKIGGVAFKGCSRYHNRKCSQKLSSLELVKC